MKKPQPDVVRRESVWDESEFRKHVMDWGLARRDVRAIDRYAEALATVTRVSAWVWERRIRAGYRASGLSRRTDDDGLASFLLIEGGGTLLWDRMSNRVPLDVETPQEAWERLAVAGLIPVGAVDDPSRRFQNRGQNYRAMRADAPSSCPPSVLTAVAFAADWPAMATAEALAAQARHEDAAQTGRPPDEDPFVLWEAVRIERMKLRSPRVEGPADARRERAHPRGDRARVRAQQPAPARRDPAAPRTQGRPVRLGDQGLAVPLPCGS